MPQLPLVGSNVLLTNGTNLLLIESAAPSTGGGGGGGGPPGGSGGGTSGLPAFGLSSNGQSNAVFAFDNDNALTALAQGIQFFTGAASFALYHAYANPGSPATEVSSIGILELTATYTSYTGAALQNTAGNANVTVAEIQAAPVGAVGIGFFDYCNSLTAAELASVNGIAVYWGESDSTEFTVATKQQYKAACINWMAQMRSAFQKTAAELPIWWSGPPFDYGANAAAQLMEREVWTEIAADPAQNSVFILSQTYDTIGRDYTINSTTGYVTAGSNGGHRSAIDNFALFARMSLGAARSILTSLGYGTASLPTALGQGLGPSVTSAVLNGSIVTCTVQHDGGTDIVIPLLAAQGVGWVLMDGGTISEPGRFIQATACTRINATQFNIQFEQVPTNAPAACRLFYPFPEQTNPAQPNAEIGRGCAVTDNLSTIFYSSAEFNIAAKLGQYYGVNMPIRMPMTVSGSGSATVAASGIALS
jgi:hypothetical protein